MLVCGPTGEGKSTTLYSLIAELAATGKYIIITFEDPIERYIDGIAQSQIREAEDPKNNYGFPRGMRSALRQDPNIIEVGEIRDAETALTAVQSSQTGPLIFSTLGMPQMPTDHAFLPHSKWTAGDRASTKNQARRNSAGEFVQFDRSEST